MPIMIRTITRPSTAACTLPMYIGFLLSEPHATSCLRLGNLLNISHDSVNRFLNRESYTPRDMFDEAKSTLNLIGGVLSVDDSVLDKPYSNYIAYVGYYYSGKHHAVVKGINLITLYYTDSHGNHQPVNFRVYDKSENKTKNDYFQEMFNHQNFRILVPKIHTGEICKDILNDPQIMEEIKIAANSTKKINLTAYSTSWQFLDLVTKLKNEGLSVNTPESPEEVDAWSVNFFGSKSGIRQLAQQGEVDEPDLKMGDGLIISSIIDAAKIAAIYSITTCMNKIVISKSAILLTTCA